jgi:hypothetical protein
MIDSDSCKIECLGSHLSGNNFFCKPHAKASPSAIPRTNQEPGQPLEHPCPLLNFFNMPCVQTSLEYLQDLPLYEEEKPYWCFLTPRDGFDPDKQRIDNLEFEAHGNITIHDMRESGTKISLDECGFQVLNHKTKSLSFETAEAVAAYKAETEDLLRKTSVRYMWHVTTHSYERMCLSSAVKSI